MNRPQVATAGLLSRHGAGTGLTLLAAISLAPLVLEHRPMHLLGPYGDMRTTRLAEGAVLLVMAAALAARARADRVSDGHAGLAMSGFATLAAVMTAWHWQSVDRLVVAATPGAPPTYAISEWQRDIYEAVLNGLRQNLVGFSYVPHAFRPLPYGFTRSLELVTRDWGFSCLAYRWFFSTWFLWATFRFARLFLLPTPAWLVVAAVAALYPFSIWYYWGQLTDPLSHALFVLALIYVVQDRWLALAGALALGVLAKETAVVLVPAYWLAYWRDGVGAWVRAAAVAAACVAAYLAVRIPLGWTLSFDAINGTADWMLRGNFMGDARYPSPAPIRENYLFPAVYVGVFLPLIGARWRGLDRRLRVLVMTLVPLVLLTNACFGWMHEARNYLPLVPLLATAALRPADRPAVIHGKGLRSSLGGLP